MTEDDDEIDWHERAIYWELLYLRATEGARAANRGIERLKYGHEVTKGDLRLAEAANERLRREVAELEKKVTRLSLRLVSEWGRK